MLGVLLMMLQVIRPSSSRPRRFSSLPTHAHTYSRFPRASRAIHMNDVILMSIFSLFLHVHSGFISDRWWCLLYPNGW